MILSNLLLAVGMVGATAIMPYEPPHTQPHNAVTTTEYEYQYQTNEVNSINDLIVGNIYKLNYFKFTTPNTDKITLIEAKNAYLTYTQVNNSQHYFIEYQEKDQNNNYLKITRNSNNAFIGATYQSTSVLLNETNYTDRNLYFIYKQINEEMTEEQKNDFINAVEISNYLGDLVPVETTTNGLYNTIEEFIETYLFNNDKLKETEYTIMGATYNMAEWLAHTTTMVMMILILGILLYFVKWCFKQISNTFTLIGAN